MKYFIPGLLLSYLVYSAVIPAQTPHSFILFSLAGLYGFSLYLEQKREQTSKLTQFAQIQESLEKSIKEQKEASDAKITRIEEELRKNSEELGKISLTITRVSPSSKSDKPKGTMVF